MKKMVVAAVLPLMVAAGIACAQQPTFKSDLEKVSYSLGVNIANNLKKQGIEIDPAQFAAGFKDAISGSATKLSEQEIQETLTAWQQQMMAKKQAEMAAEADKNKKAGDMFLEQNKTKPGVKTTASGLQYKILSEGNGPNPKDDDVVTVNYRGTLVDGTEFDSTAKHGAPATFPVNGVIPGWSEALKMMKVGAKWQLYIPADLAYGARGAGGVIPPNATLIFDVELVGIKAPETK